MSVGPGAKGKTVNIASITGMEPGMLAKKIAQQEVVYPALDEKPEPPDWLLPFKYAVEQWDIIAPEMVKHKLLTNANVAVLAIMCAAYHQLVEKFTENQGFTQSGIALIPQYRMLVSEFGLTPTSQLRAKAMLPPADAPTGNAFTKNKRTA